jgi:hypothetical protein
MRANGSTTLSPWSAEIGMKATSCRSIRAAQSSTSRTTASNASSAQPARSILLTHTTTWRMRSSLANRTPLDGRPMAPQALIGPGDVDLADESVREGFLEQVGEAGQYRRRRRAVGHQRHAVASVIEADFLAGDAGTKRIDERIGRDAPALERLRVGTRVATAIMLLSPAARTQRPPTTRLRPTGQRRARRGASRALSSTGAPPGPDPALMAKPGVRRSILAAGARVSP